jgi:hypothetical protein
LVKLRDVPPKKERPAGALGGLLVSKTGGVVAPKPRPATVAEAFVCVMAQDAGPPLGRAAERKQRRTTVYFETLHARVRLQLVLGDDRAEVSLDNLERLENRSLC